MPVTITTKEIISVTLGLELNGQPIAGTFSPQIAFQSDNTAVCGVKDDPAANTLDLEITGPGSANLVISCDCTFINPQTGAQITQSKTKSLSISVVKNGSNFEVTIS